MRESVLEDSVSSNPGLAGMNDRRVQRVLGVPIDMVHWDDALKRLISWGDARQSLYVCICNVHSVITCKQDPEFSAVVENADLATPDGMPVAWMLRRLADPTQPRINGPDLMWRYLALAQEAGQVVSFYGGSQNTLDKLEKAVMSEFPALRLGAMISPPFRELTDIENKAYTDQINDANTAVLFVGLGCPKQEKWMASRRGSVMAVMLGVGAAFDYHAGTIKRAPLWMQSVGLEWLHRLCSEPRRLWRRYLITNTLFVIGAIAQLLSYRPGRRSS